MKGSHARALWSCALHRRGIAGAPAGMLVAFACLLVAATVLAAAPLALASGIRIPAAPDPATWVTDGAVSAVAVAADGTTYIGGEFDHVGPQTGCGAPLGVGGHVVGVPLVVDGTVLSSVSDGSGGFYIGGLFTSVGGTPRDHLAHILADGTLDATWDPGANDKVYALAISGGTVYAGGLFTTVGGQTRNHIAALDAATGAVTGWDPDADNNVAAIAVSGDTVYAGGIFTAIGGQARTRIAALDASAESTGTATAWNAPANGPVSAIAVSGDTVYAGGSFLAIGGQSRHCLAALKATTGEPTDWNPSPNNAVYALAVSGDTVYAGGKFLWIAGQSRPYLAAVDAETGTATGWAPAPNNIVNTLAVSGATIVAGGSFTAIGGATRNYVAAVDATTATATPWDPDPAGIVYSLAVSGDTSYVGGEFWTIGRDERSNIAALDASGAATTWDPAADGVVSALAISGTTVYAGGSFTAIGGEPRSRIAALDAASGGATAWDPSADDVVSALAVSGGIVYAGGSFANIGGAARSRIAALDGSGGATAWAPEADSGVVALAVSGDRVYAAGSFTTIGAPGVPRNRIAALDVTTALATDWDPGADNVVLTLAVSGDTVYAGGRFAAIGGAPRNRIAALDASADSTGTALAWAPDADSTVNTIAASGGKVYVGGYFQTIGGETRHNLAEFDESTGLLTSWDPGPGNRVAALAVSGTTLYAGGYFQQVVDTARSFFAAFRGSVTYDIAPSVAGGRGTVSPDTTLTVDAGATPTFTFTPVPGYEVSEVRVDGTPVTPTTPTSYTFPAVAADQTISVTFTHVPVSFVGAPVVAAGAPGITIGTTTSIAWRTNAPVDTGTFDVVAVDQLSQETTIVAGVPADDTSSYETDWRVMLPPGSVRTVYVAYSGGARSSASGAVRVVNPAITVTAPLTGSSWSKGTTQTVEWSISPTLEAGAFRVWATPAAGGTTRAVSTTIVPVVPGQSAYGLLCTMGLPLGTWKLSIYYYANGTTYTSQNVVKPLFTVPSTVTITSSKGSGGTISPLGVITIDAGSGKTFTLTPNAGYHVKDVLVSGTSVGNPSSYQFTNVTSNQTIAASFERNPALTVTAPLTGTTWSRGTTQTVSWTVSPTVAVGSFRVWATPAASGTTRAVSATVVPVVPGQAVYSLDCTWGLPAGPWKLSVYYYAYGTTFTCQNGVKPVVTVP